jgi:Acetyltransferase (GNAT) domain
VRLEAHELEGADWDAFVATSPQGSVFCDSRFLEATGVRWETLALGSAGGPEAAALVVFDRNEPVRAPGRYAVYQGILFGEEVFRLAAHRRIPRCLELVEGLIEALAARQSRVSFCLHPSFRDVRPFSWFHYFEPELGRFAIDVQYTAVLDLDAAGPDETLARARSVRRQDRARALRAGFFVEESRDVAEFLRLYRATFERQKLAVAEDDLDLVESIAQHAVERGFGQLFASRAPDGTAASVALFLQHASTAYYLFGANDPALRRSGASTLLLFEAMERCRDRGLGLLDMVGVNSPQRGDYKTSFGAELRSYFVVDWERPASGRS